MVDVFDAPNGVVGAVDEKKPALVEVMAPVDDAGLGAEEVEDEIWDYPYPTDFKISERTIDDVRSLKVCGS